MLYKKGDEMRKRLRFCCDDRDYQGMMADYVRKHWQEQFLVVQEEGEEEILVTEGEEDSDSLGRSEEASSDSGQEREIFYLSEEPQAGGHTIYRYQNLDHMMRELLFKTGAEILPKLQQKTSRLILFFTPGGNCAQTLAAKQFAKRMGAMEKVLYIHYGAFGITSEEEVEGEGQIDLSTLCFYIYSQKQEALSREKILAAVRKADGYDYLAYFHNPIHVAQMKEEFSGLLEKILSYGLYDRVILDLDELPYDLETILHRASELYCVIPSDEGIRESYSIRCGQWQAFLKKIKLDPVDLMVKEWEYRVG